MPSRRYCIAGEVVADRPPGRPWMLRLEYQFDRLLPEKLAQAYELLVPARVPAAGAATGQPGGEQEVLNDATGRYLRPCVLGPPEREPHDLSAIFHGRFHSIQIPQGSSIR